MVKKYKKYTWLLLLVFAVVLPLATAHAVTSPTPVASGCNFFNFTFTGCVLGTIFNGIGWLFLTVGAFFGMILAWAVSWILAFGQNIVNTPAVQGGFAVTLAIANLGFVMAVIIFAITTILRIQNYGGKKLLVNVVIAAVLVNFGLVLAGAALTFSDSVTNYFLDAVTGANSANGTVDRYAAFRNKMFNAFQPEQLQIPDEAVLKSNQTAQSMAGATTGKAETLSKTFISMLMSIIGIVLVIITLATFVIMLVIRYVWLVLLLVLLPLAWLAKVFPGLSGNFNTWWEKFLAQLLFPPAALFFLWLSLMVSKNTIALTGSDTLPTAIAGSNPIGASFIGPLFNTVVLTFMMLGGLMAAQKLGSSFAAHGLKMANGAGKWAGKRAGRTAKRAVSRPFQGNVSVGGVKLIGDVQGRAQKMMTSGSYLTRLAGRGLSMASRPGGANQVADYEKQYGGLDKTRLLEELRADPLGHNKNSRAAILGLLQKAGGLGDLTQKELGNYVAGDENKATFDQIGASKIREGVMDASGLGAQEDMAAVSRLEKQEGTATDPDVKKKISEDLLKARASLQKRLGKMSAETMAGFFKAADGNDPDGTKGKNPLGMGDSKFGEFKAGLAKAMVGAQGVTASKYSSFVSQLQEKGDESQFIAANAGLAEGDINAGIKKWLDNSAAQNLGVSSERYYTGASTAKTAAGTKEQDEALKGVMNNTPDNEAAYEEAQRVRRENASKSKGLI